MALECIIPIQNVKNLTESLNFYETSLGFKIDWLSSEGESRIAGISRDKFPLYLSERPNQVSGISIWIGVEDIEKLHSELLERRGSPRMPLQDFPWGCEFQVEDLDGHTLRICGAKKGQVRNHA